MVISGKDVVGTLKITNSGTAAAAGVSLTGASLQTAAGVISASNLPLSVSSIAAGGSQTLTLTFPGAAPASATAGLVKLTGSYLPSGAFSLSGVGSIP